jgi:NAD(P)-dependent dehydrogenase (short-subunit alcohol dehydrogenase family)
MSAIPYHSALVVGTGPGISASVAKLLTKQGVHVAVASRNMAKLQPLAEDIGAEAFAVDATDPDAVDRLFDEVEAAIGVPEIVIYNAGMPLRMPIVELDPQAVRKTIEVGAFGAFLVVQQAAKRLIPRGAGAILLTGATASTKGFANSSAFAIANSVLEASRRALPVNWALKESTSRIS